MEPGLHWFFYIAGTIVIGFGIYLFITTKKLNSWLQCPGTVSEIVAARIEDSEGHSHAVYGVKYRYRPTDREYSGESSLKGSWKNRYKVGDELTVAYNPANEAESDQFELFQQRLYLFLVVPGLGLVIAGWILAS